MKQECGECKIERNIWIENGGEKVDHGSGGIVPLRAA